MGHQSGRMRSPAGPGESRLGESSLRTASEAGSRSVGPKGSRAGWEPVSLLRPSADVRGRGVAPVRTSGVARCKALRPPRLPVALEPSDLATMGPQSFRATIRSRGLATSPLTRGMHRGKSQKVCKQPVGHRPQATRRDTDLSRAARPVRHTRCPGSSSALCTFQFPTNPCCLPTRPTPLIPTACLAPETHEFETAGRKGKQGGHPALDVNAFNFPQVCGKF